MYSRRRLCLYTYTGNHRNLRKRAPPHAFDEPRRSVAHAMDAALQNLIELLPDGSADEEEAEEHVAECEDLPLLLEILTTTQLPHKTADFSTCPRFLPDTCPKTRGHFTRSDDSRMHKFYG